MPPAITIERPVRKSGQSTAPRHSMMPFQAGGPSVGKSERRTIEWMPSAPISTSPVAVRTWRPSRSKNQAVTPLSSCLKAPSRWPVKMRLSPRRARTAW